MSEWRTFVSEFRAPKSDVAVLLTTFLLTVLVDLTVAIEVGMVLAAFLFMRRMAEVTNISVLTHEFTDPVDDSSTTERGPQSRDPRGCPGLRDTARSSLVPRSCSRTGWAGSPASRRC